MDVLRMAAFTDGDTGGNPLGCTLPVPTRRRRRCAGSPPSWADQGESHGGSAPSHLGCLSLSF
jgi:hypothetical protein